MPGRNLGADGPLGVFPVSSDHGDVHTLYVCRTNGDSLTMEDYRRVFTAVTGRELEPHELASEAKYFAEEDR